MLRRLAGVPDSGRGPGSSCRDPRDFRRNCCTCRTSWHGLLDHHGEVCIFLLAGKDTLHLRQGGHIRESIDPKHDRLAGPGDPGLSDCLRLPAGADYLGNIVDADRPSLDKTLHVTLCNDALAGLDVDAENTLGILHAADVLEGWIVVTHGVSHRI